MNPNNSNTFRTGQIAFIQVRVKSNVPNHDGEIRLVRLNLDGTETHDGHGVKPENLLASVPAPQVMDDADALLRARDIMLARGGNPDGATCTTLQSEAAAIRRENAPTPLEALEALVNSFDGVTPADFAARATAFATARRAIEAAKG